MIALDLVIVTYNRLDKLKTAIRHYENQTVSFRNLIIVNNCSTDGTDVFLNSLPSCLSRGNHKTCDIVIINAKENMGGSGGFYLGQKEAMKRNADWVFVADDDAYADPYMVEEFYKFIGTYDTSKIAAVCAEVLNMDGSICLYHRDTYAIINKEYIRKSSCCEDYFIYFDDSEHSIRLGKYGKIVVVPLIKIMHDGGAESTQEDISMSWRDYYMVRNSTHMLLKHYPSVVIEKVYKQFRSDLHVFRTRTKLSEKKKISNECLSVRIFTLVII